jgi:hypothetical protein
MAGVICEEARDEKASDLKAMNPREVFGLS